MKNITNNEPFKLTLVEDFVKKYELSSNDVILYVSKLKNKSKLGKIVNEDYSVAVYIVQLAEGDYYIGKTKRGTERFAVHDHLKNPEDLIYYFTFSKQSDASNVLDEIEKKIIKKFQNKNFILTNKNNGNNSIFESDPFKNSFIENSFSAMQKLFLVSAIDEKLSYVLIDEEKKISKPKPKTHTPRKVSHFSGQGRKPMIRDFAETFYRKDDKRNIDLVIERIPKSNENINGEWVLKQGSKVNSYSYWNQVKGNVELSIDRFYEENIKYIDQSTGKVLKDIRHSSISPLVALARGIKGSDGWLEIKNKDEKTPCELYR